METNKHVSRIRTDSVVPLFMFIFHYLQHLSVDDLAQNYSINNPAYLEVIFRCESTFMSDIYCTVILVIIKEIGVWLMASVTPVLFPVLKQSQGDGFETLYFPVFSLN